MAAAVGSLLIIVDTEFYFFNAEYAEKALRAAEKNLYFVALHSNKITPRFSAVFLSVLCGLKSIVSKILPHRNIENQLEALVIYYVPSSM